MNDEEALIDRIRQIIEQKRMNSSYFAEQIGSSRSVITHILNGRNKPSWDILKKILEKYDDINTEWLLFGKEPMFKSERSVIKPEKSPSQPSLFDKPESEDTQTEIKSAEDTLPTEYRKETDVKPAEKVVKQEETEEVIPLKTESKKIVKIMIFYSDSTFGSFTPDMKPFE
ncbi:MAG: helix-turn-helix domain-containing protein [Dysgonamonadaceae bacterium]|jgi:transcriptional regulator with XRE-family HTH domain|nr:helix-turn-helix domain-containing protein [Dysgonamonadaceae bacterium]